MLIHALQLYEESIATGKINSGHHESNLLSRYRLMVSSVLLTTLPSHFPGVLRLYFKHKLEELNTMIAVNYKDGMESLNNDRNLKYNVPDEMNIDGSHPESAVSKNYTLVKSIGKVVLDLRNLGFTALTEDAYASSIIQLLKAVPLQFLHALLCYLGDSFDNDVSSGPISPLASRPLSYPGIDAPSEGLVRWQLRLEYFAYEKLQDLRIGKLFEIIVDYPDSSPAIEDLKQCLEYTGQHSKLVDSFISSLRYRLLTAGASTNDILHQYVSTIKALRTIDPTGVFLEAVGEPIRDYLRGRKDTIKCIVTMLTDGSGINPSGMGNTGDSLLEELNREAENQETADTDEDINVDDKQAWVNAERWEPDPIEADPLRGNRQRGKIDILEMLVSIIGSKDQLVNEYRVMLAEKLLNKSDYDIDSEIRTLELLKIHFGEGSMQKCEIMVNDLISSKRMNANIKASKSQLAMNGSEQGETMSLDLVDATIISSNFWPPIQLSNDGKHPMSMLGGAWHGNSLVVGGWISKLWCEDPANDHGFIYNDKGQVDILQSPFFDFTPDIDHSVEEYVERIIFQLAATIDDQLSSVQWLLSNDGKHPMSMLGGAWHDNSLVIPPFPVMAVRFLLPDLCSPGLFPVAVGGCLPPMCCCMLLFPLAVLLGCCCWSSRGYFLCCWPLPVGLPVVVSVPDSLLPVGLPVAVSCLERSFGKFVEKQPLNLRVSSYWKSLRACSTSSPLGKLASFSSFVSASNLFRLSASCWGLNLVSFGVKEESLHLPLPVEQLLSDYAERFHEIKTPRKLLWKKNLGIVKLELHFDDRNVEFSVTPLHAAIIMQFQEKTSWASKSLAAAVGLPVDILNRRMSFWISKGVITDSGGADSSDHVFTLVDDLTDTNRNGISNEIEGMDEEGESSVASVEEQLQKEMAIYQFSKRRFKKFLPFFNKAHSFIAVKFIEGMLTNFGGMPLDRIHNTLKMFCVAEPTYDKSLQQLQSFLSVLRAEEKLDMRDGHYYLKK
ncbi:hypothetical protein M5K25_021706 [Dendrobium thyrsiflorum]|uniref:Anaphase-promoting complex subunit 2 n=1 Tax=Dendrobium thyrsiflorum TaxID=117978 RepID=A0ABD0U4Z6_DENTH